MLPYAGSIFFVRALSHLKPELIQSFRNLLIRCGISDYAQPRIRTSLSNIPCK